MPNNEITSDKDKPTTIKLRGFSRTRDQSSKSNKFVRDMYDRFPKNPLDPKQFAIVYGSGEDQKLALVELVADHALPDTVMIKWISTYPQRQGVGKQALRDLQALARDANVKLILTAWKYGTVPEKVLNRFYKSMGFKAGKSQSGLVWDPEIDEGSKLLDKPTPSIDELAMKYDVSPHDVLRELAKGVEIEKEHTTMLHVAREIALDHLAEDLYYYAKLAKVEQGKEIKESKIVKRGKLNA